MTTLKQLPRGAFGWVAPAAVYVGLDGLVWLNGQAVVEIRTVRAATGMLGVSRSLHDGRHRLNWGSYIRNGLPPGGACEPGFEPLPVAEASIAGEPAEQRRV